MKKIILLIALFYIFSPMLSVQAQNKEAVANCQKYIKLPFISDGQEYKALLSGNEMAEFHTTFYANNKYRIVGAVGKDEGNVIFSVFDQDNNLLFSNKDHDNSPYWDFEFRSTLNCTIEAKLNQKNVSSGYVLLQIGFEQ